MQTAPKHCNFMVVSLTKEIKVRTAISSTNHPALRSGFAGYPINPRWNGMKFHAWKTGRQLREALQSGDMIVRTSDSMLVPKPKSVATPRAFALIQ